MWSPVIVISIHASQLEKILDTYDKSAVGRRAAPVNVTNCLRIVMYTTARKKSEIKLIVIAHRSVRLDVDFFRSEQSSNRLEVD